MIESRCIRSVNLLFIYDLVRSPVDIRERVVTRLADLKILLAHRRVLARFVSLFRDFYEFPEAVEKASLSSSRCSARCNEP